MFVLAGPSVLVTTPPAVEVAEGPTLRSQKRRDVEDATPRRGSRKRVRLIVLTPASRKKAPAAPKSGIPSQEPSPSKGKGKASSSLSSQADEAMGSLKYPSIPSVSAIPDPLPSAILAILRNSYSLTKNPDFSFTGLSREAWDLLFSQFPSCEQCSPSDSCVYSPSDFFCAPCRSKFPTTRKACSFKNVMRFLQFHQQARLPPVVALEIVRRRKGSDFLASSAISDSQWATYSARLRQLPFFQSRPSDLGLVSSHVTPSPPFVVDTSKPNTPVPKRIRRVFKVSNPPDEDDSPVFHPSTLVPTPTSFPSALESIPENESVRETQVLEPDLGQASSSMQGSLTSVSVQTDCELRERSSIELEILRLYKSLEASFPDEDVESLSDRTLERTLKALENDLVSPHFLVFDYSHAL